MAIINEIQPYSTFFVGTSDLSPSSHRSNTILAMKYHHPESNHSNGECIKITISILIIDLFNGFWRNLAERCEFNYLHTLIYLPYLYPHALWLAGLNEDFQAGIEESQERKLSVLSHNLSKDDYFCILRGDVRQTGIFFFISIFLLFHSHQLF